MQRLGREAALIAVESLSVGQSPVPEGARFPVGIRPLVSVGQWLVAHGVRFGDTRDLVGGGVVNWIWILLLVVWFAPNTQQLLAAYRPALALFAEHYRGRFTWRPTSLYATLAVALALMAIFNLHKQSEFLYFQF